MEKVKIQRTQKGQSILEMTEDQAREHIEKLLWPNGPACRHCGSVNVYRMQGKACRPGLLRCRDCEKQFTVTVGTIFEDSHLSLAKWVKAIHLMVSSKKGISALQLQRNLGIGSYKAAWHMAHRIRLAMKCEPASDLLKGDVQCDETYVGARRMGKRRRDDGKKRKPGWGTEKTPVLALVSSDGRVRSRPLEKVNATTLKDAMTEMIDPSATIVTDQLHWYRRGAKEFSGGHKTVLHAAGEYVNRDGYTTNTVESYFALLKRGVFGVFHHVSKQHLHKYCDEFDFRWDHRKVKDAERRTQAIKQVEGKRLMYKTPVDTGT